MGQKVNPHGLRVGIIKGWDTTWYADKKDFSAFLKEDNVIRTFLKKKYYAVKKIDADAQLVAESVAAQLEKRISFRRAMKQAIGRTMRAGVKGVKMQVSGRLDGREIAGSEHYHDGSIPLQTLRADIDYGFAEAHTTFGMIGVKCWIYKGEVLKAKKPEGGR